MRGHDNVVPLFIIYFTLPLANVPTCHLVPSTLLPLSPCPRASLSPQLYSPCPRVTMSPRVQCTRPLPTCQLVPSICRSQFKLSVSIASPLVTVSPCQLIPSIRSVPSRASLARHFADNSLASLAEIALLQLPVPTPVTLSINTGTPLPSSLVLAAQVI